MNTKTLAAANAVRVAEATAETVPAVRTALDRVGAIAPDSWVAAGRLRVTHPDLSLADLGQLADPPLSKAAINGRIRSLLRLARENRLTPTKRDGDDG
jgi:DNA-binding protein WhiA